MGDESSTMEKEGELIINLHSFVFPKRTFHLERLEENFKSNRVNLHRCSMDLNNRIKMTDHPVLQAYYTAFLEHYPAIVSPYILWMLVLEGFNHHVRLHSEKLKNKFINTTDDKLIVTQEPKGDNNINEASSRRWGNICKDFVKQSKKTYRWNCIKFIYS